MTDISNTVRFYAVDRYNRRQLLKADGLEAAVNEVEADFYHRKTATRIVREINETLWIGTPE